MTDNSKRPEPSHREPDEDKSYTPASPVKRTLAWIALVYVLIILALTTYFYFTGTMLGNLAPLLAVPGLVGVGILTLVSWKTTGSPSRSAALVLAVTCFFLALLTLPLGIAGLLSNFGG